MEHQPYLGEGQAGRGVDLAATIFFVVRVIKSLEVLLAVWLVLAPDILGDGIVSVLTYTTRGELGGQRESIWQLQCSTVHNLVELLHEGEEILVGVKYSRNILHHHNHLKNQNQREQKNQKERKNILSGIKLYLRNFETNGFS